MATKTKKSSIDVQKFGGVDELGETKLHGHKHEVSSIETASQTKLEDDLGTGKPVVMRSFTFKLNPEAFKAMAPSKQELFDTHVKGIEMHLWRDGLTFEKRHEPHILFNKQRTAYTIFVVATPSHKDVLLEKTQTLTEIAHA
jgi:hypothetical protein